MKLTNSIFSSAYIPLMLSISSSANLALYAPATSAQTWADQEKSIQQLEYEFRKKVTAGKSKPQLESEYMVRNNINGRGDMAELRRYQNILKRIGLDPGPIDGLPGKQTTSAVVRFQRNVGLTDDGILGPGTKRALRAASSANSSNVATSDQGFAAYQQLLKDNGFDPGKVDGHPGKNTTEAIRRFQRSSGLDPDGILGSDTKTALRIENQSKVDRDIESAERRIIQSDDPDKLHLINPKNGLEYSDDEIANVRANARARQQIEIGKAEKKLIQSEDPDKLHLINPKTGLEYSDDEIANVRTSAKKSRQSDINRAEIKILNSDDPDKLHLINPATGREYTDNEIKNVLKRALEVENYTSSLQTDLRNSGIEYDDSGQYSVTTALETTYANSENRRSIEELALQYNIPTALLAGVVASEMAFDHDHLDYIQDGVWRFASEGSGEILRDSLQHSKESMEFLLGPSPSIDKVTDVLANGPGIGSVHTKALERSVRELEIKNQYFQYNESIFDPAYRSTMHGSIESAAIVLKHMSGEYNSTGDLAARDMAIIWGGYRAGVEGVNADPGEAHGYTSADWRNGIARGIPEDLDPQLEVGKNAYMSKSIFEYFEEKYP